MRFRTVLQFKNRKMPVLFGGFVFCIYQSQLTMVCFDLALQIPAGTERHRSTEGDRQR